MRNRFPKILEVEDRIFFFSYQHEAARTKRLAGKSNDSEDVLRDLLRLHETSMSTCLKVDVVRSLTEILYETGRLGEASSWLEREFTILLDNAGK
jgi:hypothetical protein